MTDASPPPADLVLRRDAVTTGWSDDELARLVRAGELSRLRRGAYVNSVLPADRAARHRLLVRATLAGLRRPAVVSHQSAAVLQGLPLWDVALDRVHVTRRPRAWNDSGAVLSCHVARLRDDEVTEVDGLAVTNPVRTALDLARSVPHEAAVVALDAALHIGAMSHDALRGRLFDIAGTPGSRSAARAVTAGGWAEHERRRITQPRDPASLEAGAVGPAVRDPLPGRQPRRSH